jgi:hypothetical protein
VHSCTGLSLAALGSYAGLVVTERMGDSLAKDHSRTQSFHSLSIMYYVFPSRLPYATLFVRKRPLVPIDPTSSESVLRALEAVGANVILTFMNLERRVGLFIVESQTT